MGVMMAVDVSRRPPEKPPEHLRLRRDLELFEGCDTDENRRDRLMRNDIA